LWMGLGFEFRASLLQSRLSTARATPPVHFALVILETGSCALFAQADLKPWSSDLSLPSTGVSCQWPAKKRNLDQHMCIATQPWKNFLKLDLVTDSNLRSFEKIWLSNFIQFNIKYLP
jgi:hypothetical protein